jgi:cytoskeletal protein RodZ
MPKLPPKKENPFTKNAIFLLQVIIIALPFVIALSYIKISETENQSSESSTNKSDKKDSKSESKRSNNESASNEKSAEKKTHSKADLTTVEIDELKNSLQDQNSQINQELAAENNDCTLSDNSKMTTLRTGTIVKTKNLGMLKKPLPATITYIEYTCVNKESGNTENKTVILGVGLDNETKAWRCVNSNSDASLTQDERLNSVLKNMTQHCGFKLSEK